MDDAILNLSKAVDAVADAARNGMTLEERAAVGREFDRLYTIWMRSYRRWGVAA